MVDEPVDALFRMMVLGDLYREVEIVDLHGVKERLRSSFYMVLTMCKISRKSRAWMKVPVLARRYVVAGHR